MSEIEIPSLLFDSAWYLEIYTDVATANADPMEHYLIFGHKEGRNPNRYFNTTFYLQTYPDVAATSINPFLHYIMYGAAEGRLPRPEGQLPAALIIKENIEASPSEKEHTVADSNNESIQTNEIEDVIEPKTAKQKKTKKTTIQEKKNTVRATKNTTPIAALKTRNSQKTKIHNTFTNSEKKKRK